MMLGAEIDRVQLRVSEMIDVLLAADAGRSP